MSTKSLTVQQRKSIFLALVSAQDSGTVSIPESKKTVAKEFEITTDQLAKIEAEGVEKEWPPLDAA